MTIACQTVTVATPITLTAQSMTITPAASPCNEPCSVTVDVTWVNNTGGTLPAGQTIGISVDTGAPTTVSTGIEIPNGSTVSHTFLVTGLTAAGSPHTICPTPN